VKTAFWQASLTASQAGQLDWDTSAVIAVKTYFFSVLIQETKDSEGKKLLDFKAKGAQDSNLVNANGEVCFYK
jgi:hypothetical protein